MSRIEQIFLPNSCHSPYDFRHSTRRADFQNWQGKMSVQAVVNVGVFLKHDLQRTGLSCVGLNGTVVAMPHSEHCTWVSGRTRVPPARLALHSLQCLGSCVNPRSWKNCCSPAEKTNSKPHDKHLMSRSVHCIDSPRSSGISRKPAVRPAVCFDESELNEW